MVNERFIVCGDDPIRSAAKMAWALPCSAVGATLGMLVLLAGGSARFVQPAFEFSLAPGALRSLLERALPFSAITFGHVILGVSAAGLERIRPHEHVHVRQYERLGVLFFIAYPLASLAAWVSGRCPYAGNRYEMEAHAACARMRLARLTTAGDE